MFHLAEFLLVLIDHPLQLRHLDVPGVDKVLGPHAGQGHRVGLGEWRQLGHPA